MTDEKVVRSPHCLHCGVEKTAKQRREHVRFCSVKCRSENARLTRPCVQCGAVFTAHKSSVLRGRGFVCSRDCSNEWSRRDPAVIHNGKRYILTNGYFRASDKSILHRVIWKETHGPIPGGFVVHHINGIKTDNRIENLQAMRWGEHTAHENRIRQRGASKRKPCSQCPKLSQAKGLCPYHYNKSRADKRQADGLTRWPAPKQEVTDGR